MSGLSSYERVGTYGALTDAAPHAVITELLGAVLDRVARAKGGIERGEVAAKGEQIAKAIDIIEGLTLSLDPERGGEIAANLARLYDYIGYTLVRANLENNVALLDEVSALVREIKTGWDAIPAAART